MASIKKQGGQRTNTNSSAGSGKKTRTPTSTSHRGSRVEPSHILEQARDRREKKAVSRATRKARARKT